MPRLDAALYHAAAALLGNGVTALFAEALALFTEASAGSVSQEDALGLLQSVCDGLSRSSPAEALTGPVRRGDLACVERHLEVLGEGPRAELYRQVSRRLLPLAELAGTDVEALRRIADRLGG